MNIINFKDFIQHFIRAQGVYKLDCALYSAIPRQVHVIKDYAVMQQCIKFIAAREGSPHNVLHSSSKFNYMQASPHGQHTCTKHTGKFKGVWLAMM